MAETNVTPTLECAVRLVHRIMQATSPFLNEEPGEAEKANVLLDKEICKKATVLIADNVADFYYKHERQEWSINDVPCVASPFSAMAIEWNAPEWGLYPTGKIALPKSQCGATVMSCDMGKAKHGGQPMTAEERVSFATAVIGLNSSSEQYSQIVEAAETCRFLIRISPWVSYFGNPCNGRTVWFGLWGWIFADELGAHFLTVLLGKPHEVLTHEDRVSLCGALYIYAYAMAFLHCKNVSSREVRPPDITDKWLRRTKLPRLTFKVLDISSVLSSARSESSGDGDFTSKAMHICRGHFRRYEEGSSGLFGRLHGTFWIPHHVRGSIVNGITDKDYRVSPSSQSGVS